MSNKHQEFGPVMEYGQIYEYSQKSLEYIDFWTSPGMFYKCPEIVFEYGIVL